MRFLLFALTVPLLALAVPASVEAQESAVEAGRTAWEETPLRPGDIVRLRIWREPDMSGDFPIDATGVAVLPRLGRVEVGGGLPGEVEERLVAEFGRYLQHSSIEVVLLRRVQVLGAVRNPGLHPVDATMTVSDVLALAGGSTTQGDPDRIELIRDGTRTEARLSASTRLVDSPLQSGDQIFVPERSWFSRNSGIIAAGLTSLVIAFLTR